VIEFSGVDVDIEFKYGGINAELIPNEGLGLDEINQSYKDFFQKWKDYISLMTNIEKLSIIR